MASASRRAATAQSQCLTAECAFAWPYGLAGTVRKQNGNGSLCISHAHTHTHTHKSSYFTCQQAGLTCPLRAVAVSAAIVAAVAVAGSVKAETRFILLLLHVACTLHCYTLERGEGEGAGEGEWELPPNLSPLMPSLFCFAYF